jgi:hypothetical protein
MDFLHAAIINFVIAATLFFFMGMIVSIPCGILGVIYVIAYLRQRNKPAVRYEK